TDEAPLKLHIFTPADHKASDVRPAIVFFFGGGWIGGKPTQFYKQSKYLASRGMVAISAEYRIRNKHSTSPQEAVKDAKSAVRWVRAHASELGVDPLRIAAGGASAGGHLAAATATLAGYNEETENTDISARPDALVLFNPVIDNGPDGYGYGRVKEYWQGFSPMHNLSEDTPPTVLFLGTKDKLIPVSTVKQYKQKMEKFGGRCDLFLYKDQPHGFFNVAKYDETLAEVDKFLTSLGFLESPQ
ncbi:alpha/beta hydrolase, partial [Photobacterium sp. OFAV2-7]|uniref:alpha/beta hydrolase n=1 Tax=Photobacterium sp. OFAV2-7 TaxID=2917748 RepID=UPI001EF4D2BA